MSDTDTQENILVEAKEFEVGTDAKSVQTNYRKEGDTYIINGSKKWITCGNIADLFLVITNGEKGITAFIVEREFPGITTTPIKGLLAGRALDLKAGRMFCDGNPDAVMETTIAKYFTSKIVMEITTDAVQVHGGNDCYNKYPVERLFREAKILEIIDGTSQVRQEIISSFGLRRYYMT